VRLLENWKVDAVKSIARTELVIHARPSAASDYTVMTCNESTGLVAVFS